MHPGPSILLKLYTTFVRPHVEYASAVWSPHYKVDVEGLEKGQRFAIRVCLGQWELTHEELLSVSGLPTLKSRRTVARLCYLFKILNNNMTDFPLNAIAAH